MAQTVEKSTDMAAAGIAQVRADIQKDRNSIIGAAMDLTDAQAGMLLDEMLAIQKTKAATKADWATKFKAKLPGKVVARFFQVDNKLDAIILFQLAAEVPLVQ